MIKQDLKYIECNKQGYHYGQSLNMFCLQKTCIDKALCCGACIQQSHKGHKTKPLKLVLLETKQQVDKIQPITIDTSTFTQLLDNKKKIITKILHEFKQKVNSSIESIQKFVLSWYTSTNDQIVVKTSGSKKGVDQLFQSVYSEQSIPQLLVSLQKILSLVPKNNQSDESLKQNELKDVIELIDKDINTNIETFSKEILLNLQTNFNQLKLFIAEKNIWENEKYKFSEKFKHSQVIVTSPLLVKASASQSYKFAVMDPQVKKSSSQLAFKVKNNSNWVAFGVCHKNIVQSKNYSFAFNSVGHGAYLVSSNGGSWSNTQSQYNNFVKAFKFTKDNIVTIDVDYDNHKVKFKKHGTEQSYELSFTQKSTDPLHPCVLFYYANDEVQFLPNFKP